MAIRTLTLGELNRTFLQRQLLLARDVRPPLAALRQLVALQAQLPNPPYTGLWTRLAAFTRADLTALMESRQVVRTASLRSTLHLMQADDHLALYSTLQPALAKGLSSFFGRFLRDVDLAPIIAAGKAAYASGALSTGALKAALIPQFPNVDADALAYAVRTYVPLVQIPPGGTWGSGAAASYLPAAQWLGRDVAPVSDVAALVRGYLASCGPANINDLQTWTGISGLKPAMEALRAELVVYKDDDGKELFDLPALPIAPADAPAPVRFIPEYDNLLISHKDRRRIIADEDRNKVFLSAARVLNTFLVDGFVRGTWKITREKTRTLLTIAPFRPLDAAAQGALAAEGESLVRFIENSATATVDVQFSSVGQ
jgi:hypothetical protein